MEVHIIFILYNRSIEQLAHKIGGNGAIGSHKALELGEERAGRRRGAPEGREGATCLLCTAPGTGALVGWTCQAAGLNALGWSWVARLPESAR